MNKRPGHVDVTSEVGYCNFCSRTRNLRSEAHHLGTLVRTILTCETCHRTLSSTMGVAASTEPEAEPAAIAEPVAEPVVESVARPKRAPAKQATTAKKPPAVKTPTTAGAKTPARRTSTKKK